MGSDTGDEPERQHQELNNHNIATAATTTTSNNTTTTTTQGESEGMGHLKDVFATAQPKGSLDEYEPLRLSFSDEHYDGSGTDEEGRAATRRRTSQEELPFSWFEYAVFTLIGVSMLWAWNMFLTAAPYFATRFASDPWLSKNFQSAILSFTTVINLGGILLLTKLQRNANYPRRVIVALGINMAGFLLLAMSTTYFVDVSPKVYFGFLMIVVCTSAFATALFQNGSLAFASSFNGRPEYLQAIMAGQGVAGVLPALAQMISVLVVPDTTSMAREQADKTIGTSAFIYFMTAVAISVLALVVFLPVVSKARRRKVDSGADKTRIPHQQGQSEGHPSVREIGMLELLRKLPFLAPAVFLCFVVTMFFPVFTAKILSTRTTESSRPRIFEPAAFIPLAFFWWNLGDLLGRMSTILPLNAVLRRHPVALFVFSIARMGMIPLYLLCNIGGRGAVVGSDLFYLLVVQFPFGLTNGILASNSMMAASEVVEADEREAVGGFMGFSLVGGLTVGSLLSFTVAGI